MPDAERQALALMDHPNIAKILDGGATETGSPYFVMELVKGVPITEYCDAKKLDIKERLELFIPICQAIQHAHHKGIIHRDIKPSNVLVASYDDRPVPKVVDFGVAKATGQSLTDQTLNTGFGVVRTPQYMSPEQATMNQFGIDELRKAGFLEILRVIREEEPQRPSIKLSTAHTLPSIAASRSTEPKKLSGLLRREIQADGEDVDDGHFCIRTMHGLLGSSNHQEASAAKTPATLCRLVNQLLGRQPGGVI